MSIVGSVHIGGIVLSEATGQWTLNNPEDLLSRTVRTNDTPHPTQHGVILGQDLLDARKIIFDISVTTDPNAFGGVLDILSTVFAPTNDLVDMTFTLYERDERLMRGRPRNFAVDTSVYGLATIKAEFICPDPRMYSPEPTDYGLLAPTATTVGGLVFPMTFPVVFDTNTTVDDGEDTAVIVNDGNVDAPLLIVIPATSENAAILHTPSGKFLQLVQEPLSGGNIALRTGDHSVLYYANGNWNDSSSAVNVYHWLSADSQWFDLEPGLNTLQFLDTSNTGPIAIVEAVSAWI